MLNESQGLYLALERAIKNNLNYEPDGSGPFAGCFTAAVELFAFGQTYRLYFKITEDDQIEVKHLERWYFG